jgi:hypothetical protein
MPCILTNLTPNYYFEVMGVQLRGISGVEYWHNVQIFQDGRAGSHADTLPATVPTRAMLMVTIEREELPPPGRHVARMVIRDPLGNRYRSPKVTFKDGNAGSPDGPSPPRTIATSQQPGVGDPQNRSPSRLRARRIRRQTGDPIDPPQNR